MYILGNKLGLGGQIKKLLDFSVCILILIAGCTAKQYKLSGDLFIKSGEYEKAAAQYKKWAKRETDNPKPFVSLSLAYYKQEDYKKSAEYLKKAFEIDKSLAKEAVMFYENLLEIDSYIWKVFYNGTKEFMKEQQFKIALGLIEEAEDVTSSKYKAMAYVLHGRIYIMEGDSDKALEYLLKALDLDDNNVDAYIYIGEAYTYKNNTDQAISYLKKAISLDPEIFEGYKLLGQNYLIVKKYDLAIEMFEKASSIVDNDPYVLYNLAYAYLQKEDYSLMKGVAEKVLGLPEVESGTKAEAYILLGMSGIYTEKYSEAIEALKKAIEVDPGKCDSYQLLAHAYNKTGKISLSKEFSKKWEDCVAK